MMGGVRRKNAGKKYCAAAARPGSWIQHLKNAAANSGRLYAEVILDPAVRADYYYKKGYSTVPPVIPRQKYVCGQTYGKIKRRTGVARPLYGPFREVGESKRSAPLPPLPPAFAAPAREEDRQRAPVNLRPQAGPGTFDRSVDRQAQARQNRISLQRLRDAARA
jgi:hypothetical protein